MIKNALFRFSATILMALLLLTSSFANPAGLPANLIPLASPKGAELFNQDQKSDYFWRLNLQFVTQINPAYCSVASSVMILNALNIARPNDPQHPGYKLFTQANFFNENVEKVMPSILVNKEGATLMQVRHALATFGVKAEAFHAKKLKMDQFRTILAETIKKGDGYIMVNFLRKAMGEEGGGHWSPLAAYDPKADRFLLLDVARYRYPSVWVKTEDLWNAVNTYDKVAKSYRGFVIVKPSVSS